MSRKDQLIDRATRYASAHSDRMVWQANTYGFQDGYRAAMRDLRTEFRRALNEAPTPYPEVSLFWQGIDNAKARAFYTVTAIQEFLRPLR